MLELAVESGCDYIVTFNTKISRGRKILESRPSSRKSSCGSWERYHEHGRRSDTGLADEADTRVGRARGRDGRAVHLFGGGEGRGVDDGRVPAREGGAATARASSVRSTVYLTLNRTNRTDFHSRTPTANWPTCSLPPGACRRRSRLWRCSNSRRLSSSSGAKRVRRPTSFREASARRARAAGAPRVRAARRRVDRQERATVRAA